jgi:hypothetical protein
METNLEKLSNYTIKISPLLETDGGGFQALYPQLDRSLVGYGETQVEAFFDLLIAGVAYLEMCEENSIVLSEPETVEAL